MPKQHTEFSKSFKEFILMFGILQLNYCSIIESIEKLGKSTELKKVINLLRMEAGDLEKIQLGLVLILLKEYNTLFPKERGEEAVK